MASIQSLNTRFTISKADDGVTRAGEFEGMKTELLELARAGNKDDAKAWLQGKVGSVGPLIREKMQALMAEIDRMPGKSTAAAAIHKDVATFAPQTAGAKPAPIHAAPAASPTSQLAVVAAAQKQPSTEASSLELLRSLPAVAAMSASQRQSLELIHGAASSAGKADLVALAKTNKLSDLDSTGRTLLDNLSDLATKPLDPGFAATGVSRASLLSSTLQEVANPNQINQGARRTCQTTTMSWMVAKQNPAEYARLIAGLASPDGEVKMKNGDDLERVSDSIAPDSATTRSPSERLLQSALYDYCNGSWNSYSNVNEENVKFGFFSSRADLGIDAVAKGLTALTGTNYTFNTAKTGSPETRFDQLRDSPLPTVAGLNFGKRENEAAGHAVNVTRIESGRVYYRNPWGSEGEMYPPRRSEGPGGEESMLVEHFAARMTGSAVRG